ncbi:beta-propeller domain-containing protein [Candidatus Bathyarchaeota archaeon]|nr:beta-propeller domain-containing protein [Candidatus Bathyarchaeota archaeon]
MYKASSKDLLNAGNKLAVRSFSAVLMGLTLGLLVINLVLFLVYAPSNIILSSNGSVLLKFSSYTELKNFINRSGYTGYYPYYYVNVIRGGLALTASRALEASFDYSKTNVQVEGVDEADIVKSDGEYLYLVSNNKVLIIKAYPADEAQVVAEIQLNGTVSGLFINGDRLVVFESSYQGIKFVRTPDTVFSPESVVHIRVYDVVDRGDPVLMKTLSADGWYFSSRMIGDYVYVIVTTPVIVREGEVSLPIIIEDGRLKEAEASDIYYTNVTDYGYGYTTVFAVNVVDDSVEPTYETFLLGASTSVYASLSNVYLAIPYYDYEMNVETTHIVRIRIQGNTISSEASGVVPGHVLNQFSMDEYGEYFRIATTISDFQRFLGETSQSNNVYVLDMNLTIVGRLEDIAPGESIYSARFMGAKCYLVTFKKVDPLFVIGLDDPASPRVLGKLKIPGFSDYLHPYSENLLIGVGKETVEAEEGDFAWYQGVKIALFDVSDMANPRQIASYVIGDRGTDSPVLYDHKAFLFDRDRNLLALPILLAEIDESQYPEGVPPNAYGDYVWQGLYVFTVTEDSISLRGRVTHMDNNEDLLKSGYYFDSKYSVKRSLYIEDMLYSISDAKIAINDLTSLELVNEVKLP